MSAHQAGKRGKQGGESVYGEHPDGGRAGQAEISSAKSVEGGEDHLQKPSQKPTVYIVVNKFFHINKDNRMRENYAATYKYRLLFD